jgi:hypothetical protein
MKNIEFQNEPQIFTTGAFLKPMKIIDSEGKEFWVWYISEFIESSFKDGEEYNPKENATSFDELVTEFA